MVGSKGRRQFGRLATLVVAGALAVGITACGGNGDDSSTTATASSASSTSSAAPGSASSPEAVKGAQAAVSGLTLPKLKAGILHVQGAAQSDQMIGYSLEDALKKVKIPYTSLDPQGDPAKTAADLDTLIAQNPDVIFGISVEPAQIQAQLTKMKQKGIPFINVGGTVHESPLVALSPVPSDYAQAALASQYLLDELATDNTKSPGVPVGKVAVFGFDPIYSLLQRRQTFGLMAKQAPGVQIVANHQVDFKDPNKDIEDATKAIVQSNPGLNAIYTCCDFTLPPIVAGLRDTNMAGKVHVVSVQLGTPAVLDLIKQGSVDAVGNAALGASSWMAVDQYITAKAQNKPMVRDAWQQYGDMFAYSMVNKDNVDPSFALRPDFKIQSLVVNYPAFFTAKWAKQFGTS